MEAHVLESQLILPVVPLLHGDAARRVGILHVQEGQEVRHGGADLLKLPMLGNQGEAGGAELVQRAHIPGERAHGDGPCHHLQRRQQIGAYSEDAAHQVVSVVCRVPHIAHLLEIGSALPFFLSGVFQNHLLHAVDTDDFSHLFIVVYIVQQIGELLLHSRMAVEDFHLPCGKFGESPERAGAHTHEQYRKEPKGGNRARQAPHQAQASRRSCQAQMDHQGNRQQDIQNRPQNIAIVVQQGVKASVHVRSALRKQNLLGHLRLLHALIVHGEHLVPQPHIENQPHPRPEALEPPLEQTLGQAEQEGGPQQDHGLPCRLTVRSRQQRIDQPRRQEQPCVDLRQRKAYIQQMQRDDGGILPVYHLQQPNPHFMDRFQFTHTALPF